MSAIDLISRRRALQALGAVGVSTMLPGTARASGSMTAAIYPVTWD
jgi:hypothetical protein